MVVLALAGFLLAPALLSQTGYPATAVARVTKRATEGSRDTHHSPIPAITQTGEVLRSRARIDYELRANDGSVLIVQTASDFPVGACVTVSGYADGPSRTHFSFGRAKLEPSDQCR
jgi:hypothetical protein